MPFELTQGQPWLVNALRAKRRWRRPPMTSACHHPRAHPDRQGILIQRQDTHLDSLAERLREPRVRRVIEPMLAGAVVGRRAAG